MKKSIFLFFAAILCAIGMSAATPEKLYLTPNSNWKQSNARFAAYFFSDNGNTWVSMTKVAGETDLYEVTAPAGYPKVIFCRMNPSASANNWSNKWNQTGDLTIPTDGKNHFTISGSGWDNFTTTWSIWPVPAVKTYKDIVFTITANEAPTLSWKNAGDKLADGSVAMEATGNANEYTCTLQEVDELAGVDYTLAVGTIKTTEKNTTVNVTADFKDLLPQVVVMGVVDWNGNKMTVADDYLSTSVTLTLAGSKTLALKLTIDGDWMGDTKNAITKDKNSSIFNSNGNNGSIQTDLSGEYVFTYTYANKTLTVTYPTEVVEVKETYYIVGTKNLIGGTEDWQIAAQKEMTDENEDKIFECTFENLAAATYEFKINNNKDAWGNAKGFDALDKDYEGVTAGNDNNIKLTLSEAAANPIVVKYNSTEDKISFEGLTEKAPEPTFDYYVIGTVNEWGLKDAAYGMTDDDADGVYEKEVTLAIGTHELKVNNGTWSDGCHWGFGDLAVAYEETADKSGNIMITVAAEKTITVKFDKNTKKITLDGLTVKTNVVTYDYYIVGSMNSWNQSSEDYGMSDEDEDGIYEKTLTLKNNDEFKVKGTAWYGFDAIEGTYKETSSVGDKNIKVTFATDTEVTVKFNSETKKITFEGLTEAAPVVDVYTVVGSDVLLGTAWDLNNADNEMTKQDDGSYVLVKENVDLAKTGTYEYKVVKNHDWAWSVPSGNANLTLKLGNEDVDGTYNVTFTLNKELNALTTSLELVEAKKVIPECYVAGDESLTGQDWNAKSVSMTYDETTEVYTATLTAVPAGTHNMKVVYGGEWLGFDHLATPAPANVKEGEDKKIQFTLAEAGDVTVTYHATNGIGLTGNFAAPVTYDYYIAGTLAGGWSATQQGMIKDGDLYKAIFSELPADTYQFKITDGQWNTEEDKTHEYTTLGADYEEVSIVGGNVQIVTEEAKNITVIFDGSKITFDGLTEKAPAVVTYVLMGVNNDWTTGIALTQNPDNADEYVLTCQSIAATDAVKVVKCEDGVATAWYGSVKDGVQVTVNYDADGNIQLPVGTYNFYFDSSLDDKQLWIEAATYTRTATPGSFSTICLPYAGTISGATLFDLSDRDANYVYVVEVGTELVAGKPYVILPTEDKITVTYKNYDYVAAGSYNALYGTYEEMDSDDLDGKYVITGDKYYYVDKVQSAGSKLLANRAYFNLYDLPTVPASAPGARRIALGTNGQNTATGMENVDASAQPVKMIIDGQLYILRGEKMYDAQGKFVK